MALGLGLKYFYNYVIEIPTHKGANSYKIEEANIQSTTT